MPPVSPEGVPQFDRATARIYDAHLLLRSYLVLVDLPALVIPEGVEALIETVYQASQPPEGCPPALATFWTESSRRLHRTDAKEKRQAAIREIPAVDADLIDHRSTAFDEESEEVHTAHQAMTRLGGPSVEVVCLYDRGGEAYLTMPVTEPIDLAAEARPRTSAGPARPVASPQL